MWCVQKVWSLMLYRNEQTLIFFNTVTLVFNTLIPVSFPLIKAPLKNFFRYGVKLYPHISFNVLHVLKSQNPNFIAIH